MELERHKQAAAFYERSTATVQKKAGYGEHGGHWMEMGTLKFEFIHQTFDNLFISSLETAYLPHLQVSVSTCLAVRRGKGCLQRAALLFPKSGFAGFGMYRMNNKNSNLALTAALCNHVDETKIPNRKHFPCQHKPETKPTVKRTISGPHACRCTHAY